MFFTCFCIWWRCWRLLLDAGSALLYSQFPPVLEWTSAQPDSHWVTFVASPTFLFYFYPFQSWSGSWLGSKRRSPRSSQKRQGDFVRLSAGGILISTFLDPILCQFVGRSRNMFALLILTTTASAQDYCAITPKHTACGQKVKLKCFDCKIFSVSVGQQLGILNPSAKLSTSIWWRVLTKDVSGS